MFDHTFFIQFKMVFIYVNINVIYNVNVEIIVPNSISSEALYNYMKHNA